MSLRQEWLMSDYVDRMCDFLSAIMGSGRAYTKSGNVEKFEGIIVQWGTGEHAGVFTNNGNGYYTVTADNNSEEIPFTGQSTNYSYIMYCPFGRPYTPPFSPKKYFAFKYKPSQSTTQI